MKKFWIIFAVLSIIGIIVIWLYNKNNKKKVTVYQEQQAATQEVGAKEYIDSLTTGINALSGLFGSLKKSPRVASTGGSGGAAFTPTPGVKYPSTADLKRI